MWVLDLIKTKTMILLQMPELLVQITDELKNDVDLTFRFINTSSTNIKV